MKNIKKSKIFKNMNMSILENKVTLYIVFILALAQVFMLLYSNEFYYATIFLLVGILTSFFTKNMIIILLVAMCFTSVVKFGPRNNIEGLENAKSNEEEKEKEEVEGLTGDSEDTETTDTSKLEKDTTTSTNTSKSEKDLTTTSTNTSKSEKVGTKDSSKVTGSALALDNGVKDKETFSQQDVVYTSDEDKDLKRTEKMILAQEKMLERMNKYKPLLDTINGIAKNVSTFSKVSSDMKE